MSVICPLMSNPDVAREFNELKDATTSRAAYAIWSLNNGNMVDKAPNGEPSILFDALLSKFKNRLRAIKEKAKYYTKSFFDIFGDWINNPTELVGHLDKNGEPTITNYDKLAIERFLDKLIPAYRPLRHRSKYGRITHLDIKREVEGFIQNLLGVHIDLSDIEEKDIKENVEFFIRNEYKNKLLQEILRVEDRLSKTETRATMLYLDNMLRFLERGDLSVLSEYDTDTQLMIKSIFPKLFFHSPKVSTNSIFGYYKHALMLKKGSVYDEIYREVNLPNVKRFSLQARLNKLNTIKTTLDTYPRVIYRINNKILNLIDRIFEELLYLDGKEQKTNVLPSIDLLEKAGAHSNPYFDYNSTIIEKGKVYSATEVLNYIKKDPQYKDLVSIILKSLSTLGDIKIAGISDTSLKYNSYGGLYNYDEDGGENAIYINVTSLLYQSDPIHTILHELIHGITSIALDNNPTLLKLIKQYMQYLIDNGVGNDFTGVRPSMTPYGLKAHGKLDSHEFIAEFMTNRDFLEFLKNIPAMEDSLFKSIFDSIIDWILNILGVNKNAYDQIKPIVTFVVEYQDATVNRILSTPNMQAHGFDENGNTIGDMSDFAQEMERAEGNSLYLKFLNNISQDIENYAIKSAAEEVQKDSTIDPIEAVHKAKKEWIEQRQRQIIGETQLKLAEAYGLTQEVDEDGRIRFTSDANDEKTQLIIDFLDYISEDTQGYYDFNSKSTAAHHVIAISLTNGDPSTFSHELAHHYVRMFWRSKLIQTALRAVDKPGMSDELREEALVDLLTSNTNDMKYMSSIESQSFLQKIWSAIATMLYNTFGIENKYIRDALFKNITRAFAINEQQKIINSKSIVYLMADQRMYKKSTYKEKLKNARIEFRKNKSVIKYEQVGADKTQSAIKSIVQGSISRNKQYRKNNIESSKILVEMQIAEDRVRKFVDDINQYRQNYLSSINATTPTRKQKKDSVYTQEELNANIELIRGFLRQANDELHDVAEKFTSMESAQYAHYISKEIVDPVTGDTSVEYLDASHINDPDVTVTEVDFKELSEINQNILGFYDATIKNLYNAIRSVEFKNTYGMDVQQELLSEITSVNSTANGDIRLNEMITHLKACYDDAISKRLKLFVHKYINEHAKSLSDDKREALIYSTNTWLENLNAFGDIGIMEVWLGLASNSKSSLIRLMQDIIDNTTQGQNNAVLERGNRLRTLRNAAIVAVNKLWSLKDADKVYGWLSPFNLDKLLMEKDDDGFTGNFITEVNEGKFYNERAAFIDNLLYSKGGIQDRLRTRLNDPKYQLEIDNKGEVVFPDGQDDLDKEYRHLVNHWMGEHAVRRFTTEYYDIRIDMLSPMTLKAQTAIQNDINDIIRACTINGKVHTELLTSTRVLELQRLYHKKSQLSNPFDEYGRRKPDGSDEAIIAKELTAWNLWQSEHIKNKMDYDAYNEAKANAKDKDAFERNNTYPTINPEIWEEIARLFPNSSSATIQDLRLTRAKLISITKKKGLFKPDVDRLIDRDTGLIKPGFEEFWSNLKHYDELIELLKNSSQSKKWTKAQQALYKSLMTQMPIMINLPGGILESWYNHIQKAIKKRLEDKYGKYDPRVASEFAKEIEQFLYTVRGTNGQMAKKGPLSIFSITQPPAVKVNTSKGLIDAVVKEPISAYSVIDAAASDPKFVDVRFNETSGKAIQPMTDDTPGNNGVSYTNKTYKKYIENGPKALLNYYNELMNTMRESYARIPFAGEYDGRLCQQGASTGQMFHRNRWWNIGKPLLYWFKRRYSINESDTDINIDYELRPDGTRSMNIPVRYIRRLDNPQEINSDVLGSVMDFYEMSLNYENKSKALPLFLTAVDKLNQTGTTRTRLKTFLKGVVNRQFYERSRNFDANEDNLVSYASTWSKKMLKWLPGLRSLTSLGLLALNWLAGIVAFIDPALQLAADAATNKYISKFDYLAGMAHVIARAPIALMSAGKSRSYDIVSSGMRKFGLSSTGAYNFHNMDRSQIRRFLQDGLTMLPFSLGEHTINAHVFASVMHSYRYNKDTKTFMNHEQYIQYAIQNGIAIKDAEWEYFKSTTLLSAYRNDKEGNMVPKNNKYGAAVTKELEEEIGKRMRNRATMANYIVPSTERTKILSNVATAFFVVMRTFMLVGIADRFKSLRDFQIPDDSPIDETVQSDIRSQYKKEYFGDKGGYNFQTGTIDDGALTALGHIFGNKLGYMKYLWYSLKHPFRSKYNQESVDFRENNRIADTDLYGIQRFLAEALIVLGLAAVQTLFHNKMVDDGDDDKYAYQVIDHILIRCGIVRYTWYSKDIVFDIVNTITPSKGDIDKKFKLIDLIIDSYKGFQEHGTHYENWEKVKSGGYKNAPKALRDLLQTFSSLGLHNLYTASSVEGIKSKTKWYSQTGGVLWKGFWHDANPGKKSSGKSKKTSKKSKDPLDNLGNLNNLDNLGNLGGLDNFDNLGGL